MTRFPAAPWPTSLKLLSAFGTLVLIGVGIGAWRAVPPSGFAHTFGSAVACVPPIILLTSVLFVVQGYEIERNRLRIRRLLWSTSLPLNGLREAWFEPAALKCSLRLFGNAGLFAFTGLYRNARLGRFRMFATDPHKAIILVLADRTLVLSPATPHAFIDHLRRQFPGLRTEPPAAQTPADR